jgi:hypothetical protein
MADPRAETVLVTANFELRSLQIPYQTEQRQHLEDIKCRVDLPPTSALPKLPIADYRLLCTLIRGRLFLAVKKLFFDSGIFERWKRHVAKDHFRLRQHPLIFSRGTWSDALFEFDRQVVFAYQAVKSATMVIRNTLFRSSMVRNEF